MSQSIFEITAARLIGQRLSHIWKGYGSALFLEFGNLAENEKRKDGSLKNPWGEVGVALGMSWRICGKQSIICGCDDDEPDWEKGFSMIRHQPVSGISLLGKLSEIQIDFENGASCNSFTTFRGQPDWAIFNRSTDAHVTVHSRLGRIEVE